MAWEFDFLVALQGMRSPIMDGIMAFLSNLGNAGVFWILLSAVLLLIPRYRKVGLEMLLSIAVTFVIGNLILKNLVARPRPCDNVAQYQAIIDSLVVARPSDWSFPSGHSMNGFTAAVALLCNDRKLGIPAIVLAALIAFSRLYNFMHFPTDVIAGIVLGTVVALLVDLLFRKKGWKRAQ
ncbi:MAG: phosphatase PAP2 family protein [Lachnospiraceae bacterium]|nr:phosphatase PAP2 family protein [Lachnospiraceae bacterium]MDD6504441.1 phosphatase PAP2 family protein [Lachnospiraceae bacterium]